LQFCAAHPEESKWLESENGSYCRYTYKHTTHYWFRKTLFKRN